VIAEIRKERSTFLRRSIRIIHQQTGLILGQEPNNEHKNKRHDMGHYLLVYSEYLEFMVIVTTKDFIVVVHVIGISFAFPIDLVTFAFLIDLVTFAFLIDLVTFAFLIDLVTFAFGVNDVTLTKM
jgi:hypothetical protein